MKKAQIASNGFFQGCKPVDLPGGITAKNSPPNEGG